MTHQPDPLYTYGDLRAAIRTGSQGIGLADAALLQLGAGDPGEAELAARAVARNTMLGAHGCTGRDCQHARHALHREWRDTTLAALGLAGDRNASHLNPWGMRRGDRHTDQEGSP
jgi:hypothetical protein